MAALGISSFTSIFFQSPPYRRWLVHEKEERGALAQKKKRSMFRSACSALYYPAIYQKICKSVSVRRKKEPPWGGKESRAANLLVFFPALHLGGRRREGGKRRSLVEEGEKKRHAGDAGYFT